MKEILYIMIICMIFLYFVVVVVPATLEYEAFYIFR